MIFFVEPLVERFPPAGMACRATIRPVATTPQI
jgi:hypothetical protein